MQAAHFRAAAAQSGIAQSNQQPSFADSHATESSDAAESSEGHESSAGRSIAQATADGYLNPRSYMDVGCEALQDHTESSEEDGSTPHMLGRQEVACFLESKEVVPMQNAMAAAICNVLHMVASPEWRRVRLVGGLVSVHRLPSYTQCSIT